MRVALRGLIVGAALLPFVACGARTGLEGSDGLASSAARPDAGDAGRDARRDGETNEPVRCTDGQFVLRRASPSVMFVLDRSQSMSQRLASGSSRWNVLKGALAATLPPVDTTMDIGALIYPSAGSAGMSCAVPPAPDLAPARGNVAALTGLLDANGPRGSTPTAAAIDLAAGALLGARAATRARALVLATDGAPACNASLDAKTCRCNSGRCSSDPLRCLDDVRTAERLTAFRDRGLPTYVIGIQDPTNDELVDILDALAVAGGRPKPSGARRYYAASSEAELTLALTTIRDEVGACTYLTASVPGEDGSIVVTVDGVPIAEGSEWSWGSRTNGEILLAGTTCGAVGEGSTLVVDVKCDVADAGRDASVRDAAARD